MPPHHNNFSLWLYARPRRPRTGTGGEVNAKQIHNTSATTCHASPPGGDERNEWAFVVFFRNKQKKNSSSVTQKAGYKNNAGESGRSSVSSATANPIDYKASLISSMPAATHTKPDTYHLSSGCKSLLRSPWFLNEVDPTPIPALPYSRFYLSQAAATRSLTTTYFFASYPTTREAELVEQDGNFKSRGG